MSQYNKPFRVKIVGPLAQPGEFRIYEALFVDGLSAGCPDATTLAKMDGAGIQYERVPWRDSEDVALITELILKLNEHQRAAKALQEEVHNQAVQIIELKLSLEAAQGTRGAKKK
jgi:hypothetical protein